MRYRSLLLTSLTPACIASTVAAQQAPFSAPLTAEQRDAQIQELRRELARIAARLDQLQTNTPAADTALQINANVSTNANQAVAIGVVPAQQGSAGSLNASLTSSQPDPVLSAADTSTLTFFRGTTINVGVDGYYGYNFDEPEGRVNLLRAYDVTSNSFNLNQASLVLERLPSTQSRFGGRVDLQFGQATETLQGSSANEQRPQVWRNLFQAYGSYLAPVGTGLQLDFGKFSSSLGNEGNYTKDQIAYSRAYSFNYLPFYHMGLRANYNLTSKVNVAYWLVNGANDTEDLNGFKSQAFLITLKPANSLVWNVNYYFGQEARDVAPTLNPGLPTSPTQPGLPTANISPAQNGREHIFDTYATWQVTPRLALIGEADYVLNRSVPEQQPGRVVIGSITAHYVLPRNWSLGARTELFDDRGGLFSGRTQTLKEATLVADRSFAPGFLVKAEYRKDWSNQRFFLTDSAGALVNAQSTATLGLMYWWGTKQGSW